MFDYNVFSANRNVSNDLVKIEAFIDEKLEEVSWKPEEKELTVDLKELRRVNVIPKVIERILNLYTKGGYNVSVDHEYVLKFFKLDTPNNNVVVSKPVDISSTKETE